MNCSECGKDFNQRGYRFCPYDGTRLAPPTRSRRKKPAENKKIGDVPNTMVAPGYGEDPTGGEKYAEISENPFLETKRAPLSTFSIDVDTASYANVRRFLKDGSLPPKDAVRIEELINYFDYDYPQPLGEVPFSVSTDVAAAPWNPKSKN